MDGAPSEINMAGRARAGPPYFSSRKSPVVKRLCALAMRQMRGPMKNARKMDPIADDPFHHHAPIPSKYARPVAPIVAPAPMFEARTVEKSRGALSARPATKKSALLLMKRAMDRPIAMSAIE